MNQTVSGELRGLEIAYDRACLKSLQKVPLGVSSSFIAMTSKIMADSTAKGLRVEPVEGADDKTMRSVRLNRGYRAIGSL